MPLWVARKADTRCYRTVRTASSSVEDTIKLQGGKIGHVGHMVKGMFKSGDDGYAGSV